MMMNKEMRIKYYLREFEKIDNGKITWNWSACLFLPYWLIYRKIYSGIWKLIVLFLCIILFCIALTKVVPEPIVLFSGMLIFLISSGIYGITQQ